MADQLLHRLFEAVTVASLPNVASSLEKHADLLKELANGLAAVGLGVQNAGSGFEIGCTSFHAA